MVRIVNAQNVTPGAGENASNFEAALTAAFGRHCGLNADWSVSAWCVWHDGKGANRGKGLYVLDDEDGGLSLVYRNFDVVDNAVNTVAGFAASDVVKMIARAREEGSKIKARFNISITGRELAHILASLRYLQRTQSPTTIGSLPEAMILGDYHTAMDSNEIDALCERINYDGPIGLPTVFVSLNADDNEFSVFVPNSIADTFEVSFLEVDDPAPASLYHSHGAKHDAETHEELCNNADYRRIEA